MVERFFLHRKVDIAIANSQAVIRELRAEGIPDRKLCLIHNGIDTTKFVNSLFNAQEARKQLGITPQALVFSSVGNLFPYKGHADLLNALSLINDQLPTNWVLLVAGRDVDGSLAELVQLTAQLGLSQHVRLLGERRDIPIILAAADIHVSASHHESLPNNILEAMCAHLPIVATAVGGVPEQVVDGVTGILVPARIRTILSEALLLVATNPNVRTAMGRRGRKRVELEFPIVKSSRALEQTYAVFAYRCRIPSAGR